jgi:NTE family protein
VHAAGSGGIMPRAPGSEEPAPTGAEAAPGGDLAIVLSGGGARAGYQVGLLRFLARHFPHLRFPIVTGVSAGAINAAFLAAHGGSMAEAALDLSELWGRLRAEDIFDVDSPSLARTLIKWAAHLVGGGSPVIPEVRGLVDTRPLHTTIRRAAATVDGELIGIGRNVERGTLKAIALTTLDYATGRTVTWVQAAAPPERHDPSQRITGTRITVDHVMASAALPIFFPAVRLGDSWYGDGGVRFSAPLSPALQLGATRILAVSPHRKRAAGEPAHRPGTGYPPPAQILSQLLNAIFLDVLDQDVERLEQTNFLLERVPPDQRDGLRPVEILVLQPSEDLGALAAAYEPRLPTAFRYLTRSLGTRETASPDFLSYLMFQPDYLERLMEIGERDAEARLPEIRRLLGAEAAGPG